MKILLISPSKTAGNRYYLKRAVPQLNLLVLEGLTPPIHQVKIVEEDFEDINIQEECDLVGITCMTSNATRAYRLSQEFRKRGKTVVMGGIHPSVLPDEALQYSDSVVIGEAEEVWEDLLNDFNNGKLKRKYHHPNPSLERYIPKIFKRGRFNLLPLQTTRGCPYRCDFCVVSNLFGEKIRHYPIKNIVKDIERFNGKFLCFNDDNIFGDPIYAKELFKAINPLKRIWGSEASIKFAQDDELVKLAAESGCRILLIGFESISKNKLASMQKSIKDIEKLENTVKKIKDSGIFVHGAFIFGFDEDTTSIFEETLEFIQKNKIGSASLNLLTPMPGSSIFNKFDAEGRILTKNWEHYDFSKVIFKPKNMTPEELQEGHYWIEKEFNKLGSLLERITGNMHKYYQPFFTIASNVIYRKAAIGSKERLRWVRENFGHH